MASFFSPKPRFSIIFDIGPSSVGAGLVRFRKGDIPQVIYSTREAFPLREVVDAKRFFKDMISALKRASGSVLKESAGLKIFSVAYSLSSPWSSSQTKVISLGKNKSFVLKKKILDRIIAEQGIVFEKEGLGSTLNLSDKLSIIEKRVVDIKLDGRTVSSVRDVPARRAELSLFLSLAPKMIIDEISDASMQTGHPKDTKIFSFPLIAYSMTRDLFHDVSDFMSIVVGGEITDVSVVHDGLILETASFPLGANFIVREVAKSFSASFGEADSILSLYFKDHGTVAMSGKMSPILNLSRDRWINALNETVARFSTKKPLPKNLFVTVDGNMTDFFTQSLRANPKLDITNLNAEKLRQLVTFSPRVRKDPFIAMITAFMNRSRALEVEGK